MSGSKDAAVCVNVIYVSLSERCWSPHRRGVGGPNKALAFIEKLAFAGKDPATFTRVLPWIHSPNLYGELSDLQAPGLNFRVASVPPDVA